MTERGGEQPHFYKFVLQVQAAQERYDAARAGRPERLATGSDDYTLFLWEPSTGKAPLARMTGHMQLINQVCALQGYGIS